MEQIKKFFPLSFKFNGNIKNLLIGILIYAAIPFVYDLILTPVTLILTLLSMTLILLPVVFIISPLLTVLSALVVIYYVSGAVISILVFANVIKNDTVAVEAAEEIAE